MSLFHPHEGFPPQLVFFWPLVWFRLRLLGAAVRTAYGKDATYRWSITPNGRVFLTCIHFGLEDKAARDWLTPRAHASDRLAAACAALCAPFHIPYDGLPRNSGRPALAANLPPPET